MDKASRYDRKCVALAPAVTLVMEGLTSRLQTPNKCLEWFASAA